MNKVKITVDAMVDTESPFGRVIYGDIIGRAVFNNQDNEQVSAIVLMDVENNRIVFDAIGVGRVNVQIGDLSHQMLHVLMGDPSPCEGHFHESEESDPSPSHC